MMINGLQVILPIIVYILLIVLIIVGILLGIRAIQTLNRIDHVVDDVSDKVQSLNGIFSVIDFTTDKLVNITDGLVSGVSNLVGRLFSKKKNKEEDD